MELAAKYVYEVYKAKGFSAAAKALFISQPALSAAIARLEKELNFRIFDRSTTPPSLTPQGRIYVESIQEIMESESNMRRRIQALSDMSRGSLTIGGNNYISYFLIPRLCGAFYKKYPQINVTLDVGNSGKTTVLWDRMRNDEIDLMFTYIKHDPQFVYEPFLEEHLVIAMHKKMKGAEALKHLAITREELLSGSYNKDREIEDMSVFRDIEFLRYDSVTLPRRMTQLLGDYKTIRYTVKDARNIAVYYNLMCAGIGAVMTTDILIANTEYNAENLLFFVPKSQDSSRTIYLARKHGALENPIIRNFVQLAKDMCASGELFNSADFNT